jgi:endonuclease/exonuclease/phosphatase (EEP) superfamily protein YafD
VEPVSRGDRARRVLPVAIAFAVPWLWFVVRDAGGPADVVAVALPIVGIAAIVVAAIVGAATRRPWPVVAGLSVFAVCAVAVLAPRLPRAITVPEPGIRLAMANVWDGNPTPEAVPASMVERGSDVLVAVEMPDGSFRGSMTAAAASSGLRSTVGHGELGAWSRFPMRELDDRGLPPGRVMRVRVDAPGTPFVLYAVHALNPLHDGGFADQRSFIDDVLEAVADERLPVVIAGDLNMSDRGMAYRSMDAALVDAMRANTLTGTTYFAGWWSAMLLRIDHVFVSNRWCADDSGTFTVAGSDHHGVEVSVGPCA